MNCLIDFSLFLFDCIDFTDNSKNLRFTYKTSEQGFFKLNKSFYQKLKEICCSTDFHTKLSKRKNDHIIDDRATREKIANIYNHKKYPQEWIDQHIWNTVIYQLEFNSKKQRLFYIFEGDKSRDLCIIKPLFLDLNHALYPDSQNKNSGSRDNVRYEKCFICYNELCSSVQSF